MSKKKRFQIIKKYIVHADTEEEALLKTNATDGYEYLVELKSAEKVRD